MHTERFTSPTLDSLTPDARKAAIQSHAPVAEGSVALTVVLDGKPHEMRMNPDQHVLDVALAAGLDLPYSCRGGVCCTCRAKVLEGQIQMDRNFTLEAWETDKGFVLSCQARPTSERLVVSYGVIVVIAAACSTWIFSRFPINRADHEARIAALSATEATGLQ